MRSVIEFPHLSKVENQNVMLLNSIYNKYISIINKNTLFPHKNKWFLLLAGQYKSYRLDLLAEECLKHVQPIYFKEKLFWDIKSSQEHYEKIKLSLEKKDMVSARYHSDQYDFFNNILFIIPWLQKHVSIRENSHFVDFESILVESKVFKEFMLTRMYS